MIRGSSLSSMGLRNRSLIFSASRVRMGPAWWAIQLHVGGGYIGKTRECAISLREPQTHPDNTPRNDSLVDKVGLQTRIVAVFESPMLGTRLGICNSPKNRLSIREDAFEFVLYLVRLPQDRHWDKTLEEGMID
eukprot:scaffold373_cov350-Pavlova_lutheri.AAC.43